MSDWTQLLNAVDACMNDYTHRQTDRHCHHYHYVIMYTHRPETVHTTNENISLLWVNLPRCTVNSVVQLEILQTAENCDANWLMKCERTSSLFICLQRSRTFLSPAILRDTATLYTDHTQTDRQTDRPHTVIQWLTRHDNKLQQDWQTTHKCYCCLSVRRDISVRPRLWYSFSE